MSELRRQRIAVTVGDTLAFRSWQEGANGAVEPGFTMDFSVNRSNKGDPNKGTVTITNPPEATALGLVMARRPPLVRVLFGWDSTGLALVGGGHAEKDGVKLTYSGPDSQLSISFVDGIAALRGSYVSVKVPKGAKASDVVAAVVAQSGLPAGVVDIAPEDDFVLSKGYTAEGGLREVLGRLGKALRADPSIQDGKVQFLSRRRSAPLEGPLFSAENGTLLGRPEPRGRDGAMFLVVATPGLLPGQRFRVESPTLFGTGWWKCITNKTDAGSFRAGTSTLEAKKLP